MKPCHFERRVRADLQQRRWLRLHAVAIATLTLAVAWASSHGLMLASLDRLSLRYGLSFAVAYLVLMGLLYLWSRWLLSRREAELDLLQLDGSGGSGGSGSARHDAAPFESGGGGASGHFDAAGEARRAGRSDVRRADDPFGCAWNVDATRVSRAGTWDGRVIVTLREVSQLVRLQESVQRAEAMATLGSLVGAVAHEVRNPLFAMSVNIDALSLMVADRADVREVLDALCRERDRTAKLMDDLLHYGRPASSRRLRSGLEPVLASSIAVCGPVANRLGLTIERTGSAAGLELLIDADRLEEVFENLLENACQHSPRGAAVSLDVRVRESGGVSYARCTVRDRGKGFSPHVIDKVFEPFFSERKGGIGLGLAIVWRIVGEHGGQVLATNAPGGGAEVVVDLPLLTALSESASE